MLRVICDLCHKEVPNPMQPAPVAFCETCIESAEDYVAGVMRIVQDEAQVQARRLENYRKEYLVKMKQRPRAALEAVK